MDQKCISVTIEIEIHDNFKVLFKNWKAKHEN